MWPNALATPVIAGLALLVAAGSGVEQAPSQPIPHCGSSDVSVEPAYARLGEPPAVSVWRNVTLAPAGCLGQAKGHAELAIALAGRFEHRGTVEDLAARAGAISGTAGTRYWSVSDGGWRTLIAQAFAVKDPETLAPRPDFTAAEILSGQTLFFAQDDTRSTGLNAYSLRGRRLGPDHATIEIVNVTDIRFLMATLFEARTLVSLHLVRRLDSDVWGYYGLSVVRDPDVKGHAKSFINRASAYYRFIIGIPTDRPPPLAP